MRLRPIEVPVRPCRVPRDAKVLMAAPALDPAVEQAVERQQKEQMLYYGGKSYSCSCSILHISLYTPAIFATNCYGDERMTRQ